LPYSVSIPHLDRESFAYCRFRHRCIAKDRECGHSSFASKIIPFLAMIYSHALLEKLQVTTFRRDATIVHNLEWRKDEMATSIAGRRPGAAHPLFYHRTPQARDFFLADRIAGRAGAPAAVSRPRRA